MAISIDGFKKWVQFRRIKWNENTIMLSNPLKREKKNELYLRKMAFSSSPIREAAVARQKIIKPP